MRRSGSAFRGTRLSARPDCRNGHLSCDKVGLSRIQNKRLERLDRLLRDELRQFWRCRLLVLSFEFKLIAWDDPALADRDQECDNSKSEEGSVIRTTRPQEFGRTSRRSIIFCQTRLSVTAFALVAHLFTFSPSSTSWRMAVSLCCSIIQIHFRAARRGARFSFDATFGGQLVQHLAHRIPRPKIIATPNLGCSFRPVFTYRNGCPQPFSIGHVSISASP